MLEIYSPELAAAQRELIYLSRTGDREMVKRAQQRLQLMGMADRSIQKVLTTGQVMYKVPVYSNSNGYVVEKKSFQEIPLNATSSSASTGMSSMESSTSSPATRIPNTSETSAATSAIQLREGAYVTPGERLFVIYDATDLLAEFAITPELSRHIRKGHKILYHPQQNKNDIRQGTIAVVEPIFQEGKNFSIARVYINDKIFQAEQLITGRVAIVYKKGVWLPREAVWFSGDRAIVFRKKGGTFEPAAISVKDEVNGLILVQSDISQWQVAANASYLVDSESFIDNNIENNVYEE